MPALLLYLLKVNVALLLFYLAYHLVLRRLTFYHLNRRFLLFGILFSTVYPFIDITPFLEKHQELPVVYFATVPTWAPPAAAATTPAFDFWQLPVWLFWLGTGVMALRLLLQFVALYKIHAASVPDSHNGIGFRQVRSISQAFSFWQNIYLNRAQHKQEELESILRHEQVHVREWHTLDVLLAEISAVFYWFNPGAWLMKKGIKENLEFIADQDVVRTGADKKEYQYLLLKATGATEPQLALPFSFPSLKRRIAMMNKMPTKKANRLRLLIALPIIAVLLLAFRGASQSADIFLNEPTEAIQGQDLPEEFQDLPDEYKVFYKRNPHVRKVFWPWGNKIGIRLETTEEVYDLGDKAQMAAAEKKYGKLPTTPPPAKYITKEQAASKAGIIDLENGETLLIPSDFFYYQDKSNLPVAYTNFLKKNPTVEKIGWTTPKQKGAQSVVIYLKSGASETYNLNNSKSMAAAEVKYGTLPNMLPPPPPVVVASVVDPRDVSKQKLPKGYADFLKLNPTVGSVGSKFNDKEQLTIIVILLESGAREDYIVNDSRSMAAATAKYKGIPELLAQPSPMIVVDLMEPKSANQKDETYIPSMSEEPADYKAFLNRNPQVKQVGWRGSKRNVLVIFLNSGATELYNLQDDKSRAAAEQKYGKLPMLPPPPPPAIPGKSALPPPPPPAPAAPPAPPAPPAPKPAPVPAPEGKADAGKISADKTIMQVIKPYRNYADDEIAAITAKFMKHDIHLEFDDTYSQGELANLKVSLASPKFNSKVSAAYTMRELRDKRYEIVLSANKVTGELKVFTQPDLIFTQSDASRSIIPPTESPNSNKSVAKAIPVGEPDFRFPGGEQKFYEFIGMEVKYPETAIKRKIKGKSQVVIKVERDGSISDIKILQPLDPLLREEILRVMNKLPKWKPAGVADSYPVFTYKFHVEYELGLRKGEVVDAGVSFRSL